MNARLAVTLKNSPQARFLIVGSMTVVVEYVVFYILYVGLNWNLFLANSLSFAVGLSMSFMSNRLWAFKKDEFERPAHHQAMIYAALAVTNLVVNNLIVGGLKSAGLDPRIGKVAAIAVIAVWNFFVYKHIIFKEKH